LQAIQQTPGVLVSIAHGELQIREGGGSISPGQVDQGQVVVDDPPIPSNGSCCERLFQVGFRLGQATLLVVEHPSVQRGRTQGGIQLQGSGVVVEGLLGVSEGAEGIGPVVEAFGGFGRERDADAEGVDSLLELSESEPASPW
jgi:hypothetical protein